MSVRWNHGKTRKVGHQARGDSIFCIATDPSFPLLGTKSDLMPFFVGLKIRTAVAIAQPLTQRCGVFSLAVDLIPDSGSFSIAPVTELTIVYIDEWESPHV